jgi:hypothetical protein
VRPVLLTRHQLNLIIEHVMSPNVYNLKRFQVQVHVRTVLNTREPKVMEGLVAQILVQFLDSMSKKMEDVLLDVVMADFVVSIINYGVKQ